jgi:hypothetical protein
MKTDNKTLLILDNPGKDETTSIIVEENEVVAKTKEFLESISKKYKKAELNVYSPVGVVLKPADSDENYAVAYEREKFVIVSHNGTTESAKLYGNWQEALSYVRRILNQEGKSTQFLLAEYRHDNA